MAPNLGCKLGSPRELKNNQYLPPSLTFWFDWSGMQPVKWHFSGSPGDWLQYAASWESFFSQTPSTHHLLRKDFMIPPPSPIPCHSSSITLLSFPDIIRDDSWDLVFIYIFIWLFVCQGTLLLLLCLVKPTGTMTTHSSHSKVIG